VTEAIHVTATHVVTNCRECPHKRNTADGWDDPFTSQPIGKDFCGALRRADLFLYDTSVIHRDCPLRETNTMGVPAA